MNMTYSIPAERVKLQNHMEFLQFVNTGNKLEDFVYNMVPFGTGEGQTFQKDRGVTLPKRAKSVLTQS